MAAIEAGGPGLLVITKPGLVVRAFAVAVTVYLPAIELALKTCAVAIPLAVGDGGVSAGEGPAGPGSRRIECHQHTRDRVSGSISHGCQQKTGEVLVDHNALRCPAGRLDGCRNMRIVMVRVTGTVIAIVCWKYWMKVICPV